MRPLNTPYLHKLKSSTLLFISILTIGVASGTIYYLDERQNDAAIINLAGQQRMLSQKLML